MCHFASLKRDQIYSIQQHCNFTGSLNKENTGEVIAMSSSKKKKCDKKSTKETNFQTLTSMFAKQTNSNILKTLESDEDDFVEITKIESKSKFFAKKKMTELKVEKNDDEKEPEAVNNNKRRKLSLRKLSSKISNADSSSEVPSASSSDNSVIVLRDSPKKETKSVNSGTKKRKLAQKGFTDKCDSDEFINNPALKNQTSSGVTKSRKIKLDSSRSGEASSEKSNLKSKDPVVEPDQTKLSKHKLSRRKLGKKTVLASDSNNSSTINTEHGVDKSEISKNYNKSEIKPDDLNKSNNLDKVENDKSLKINADKTHDSKFDKIKGEKHKKVKDIGKSESKDSEEMEEDENDNATEEEEYRIPYYLQNFQTILNSVLEDEYDVKLFNEKDLQTVEIFNSLSENGQKLYVRLFSRKLQWINCDKLKYPKIAEDLSDVIEELINVKFVNSEADLNDLDVTLKILPAPDLRSLAKTYHVNTSGLQKHQIIDILIKKTKQNTITSLFGAKGGLSKAMLEKAKKSAGRCIRMREEERRVFVRVLMLFSVVSSTIDEDSGNGGQSQLFQMLMVNMGKIVYPTYIVNKQTHVFVDRDSVILYETALQFEADLLTYIERSKWEEAYQIYITVKQEYMNLPKHHISFDLRLPDFLRRFTTGHVYVTMLSQGIEILQRRKDYHAAIELIDWLLGQDTYCLDYHGYWWERLALNLDAHLKKPSEALDVVTKGMVDDNVRVGHRLALFQRAEKICQTASLKLKHRLKEFCHEEVLEAPKQVIEGRIIPYSVPGIKHKFMTDDSYFNGSEEGVTMCNVEQVVQDYYKHHDFPDGMHAEGAIISSLFSLFFWDILFMDVPDAFHGSYQTNPLDKMSLEFYGRRKQEIDERLDWLKNSSDEDLMEKSRETWEKYCERTCAGINWERLENVEYIQGLISCIGGKLLCGILSRYAKDPRHTRSGFPDLTLWNKENKTFKIVEVKGPGDRLSHKQILWLSYLLKLGVDAEVCHVKAVGAKKLKANT